MPREMIRAKGPAAAQRREKQPTPSRDSGLPSPQALHNRFTAVPNEFFDDLLPRLTPAQAKLVCVLARQTYGWAREGDYISLNQFVEKTGLSKPTVCRAIRTLVEANVIETVAATTPDGDPEVTYYRFVYRDQDTQ